MPIYVYECSACKDVYEVEQRIVEDALKDCRCGSKGSLKRVIQPVGVLFKGAGFHINDYAGKKEDTGAPAKTEGTETPAAIPETSSSTDTVAPSSESTPEASATKSE